ncbi:DENN domain-containing protein 11-like [Watersipora subatra]|uniref:DENN domain-containing protein 11-like n=1 Tax=Watersipora subatra TaxID=2589382 RepID=UPI00355C9AEE
MKKMEDSSEVEPLVPQEHVRSPGIIRLVPHNPEHTKKDVKALEILTIFVVAFDTHRGNVIEWTKPEFMKDQLDGLEFKAIPSGAHNLEEDVVYLQHSDLYGVACYGKLAVASELERGARMRSVGVMTQSNSLLHIHATKLKTLVIHTLTHTGDYSLLEEYFQRWTGDPLTNSSLVDLDLRYPCQHFERLLSYLGPSLFTIWKSLILQKRILIYGEPPAAHLCHLVHCLNSLMSNAARITRRNMCTVYYFVNIADCDLLSRQISYLACTTEKVFEIKSDLYDVFIDCGSVRITNSRLCPVLTPTRGDRIRFEELYSTLRQPVSCDELPMSAEDIFYSYFGTLNRMIGETLHALSISDESRITHSDISHMGLHSSDRPFTNLLLESCNLDMSVGCMCDCLPGNLF